MKRGKDEGKITGPMFPRLHVNDTEKGGPRAPPRNKMALYEQLSIPSQRSSHSLPSNSEHGVANERSTFVSYHLPTRHPPSEKLYSQFSDFVTPSAQEGQRKKLDEEDFRVPIFNHSFQSRECGKYGGNVEQEKAPLSNPSDAAERPSKFHKYRKQVRNSQTEEKSKETATGTDRVSNSSSISRAEGPKKPTASSVSREQRDTRSNANVEPEVRADLEHARNRCANSALAESSAALDERISAGSYPSRDQRNPRDIGNEARPLEKSFRSVPMRNLERDDSASEISVMESVATVEMTPDDVVGVIGQKHFWKARKAILNQQRVFAVQVFELHRLVKVQKSIAESPQLLVDDSDFIDKPTLKVLPGAKIALPAPVKAMPNVSKQISEPEKPCPNKEISAENTTGKASLSSIQNDASRPSGQPATGNSPAPSLTSNPNAAPWCFNQPPGHQWLIPVMTPSEGLVYKPYPGPGFVGGGGPPGPNPAMGSFLTPQYGIPAQHPHPHYQPPLFPPSGPSGPHGYFPTYGMLPIMNAAAMSNSSVEQMNPRPIPSQASAGEASASVQHHNVSSTLPRHKKRTFADGTSSLCAPRDAADPPVRAFTDRASSPVERVQDSRGSNDAERSNELPLFPTAPSPDARRCSPARPEPGRPTQVIKVVPHNARSASESAARIFQSIQEERKQYDFV
ncbi:protein EARLY FLOWERING 3 [Salvia hispanica]|uniref:protein EARLY FLOWERING 3 n=1 Tax=Salvia hispanica TaxID=49212 RepID=UPI00200922A2|nr:protein EARLY FLOWERING 3 [Salvia hispanica]XP_047941771.1 protein EARLY FLOWERING 3 [Salvia hispanica]